MLVTLVYVAGFFQLSVAAPFDPFVLCADSPDAPSGLCDTIMQSMNCDASHDDADFTEADSCCSCGGGSPIPCEDLPNAPSGKCDTIMFRMNCDGRYDDDDFTEADSCCLCGGGAPPATTTTTIDEACDESSWPDLHDDLVCGECKVLVDDFKLKYHSCAGYCGSLGRTCVGAWEEKDDSCDEDEEISCNEELDSMDAICQCSETISPCDELSWPDLHDDMVCGQCKVLVYDFKLKYHSCDGYCNSLGRTCIGAWEEKDDSCDVDEAISCSDELDSMDAICECSAEMGPSSGPTRLLEVGLASTMSSIASLFLSFFGQFVFFGYGLRSL